MTSSANKAECATSTQAGEQVPALELAQRALRFREGARKMYEDKSRSTAGDMWFFELFHFLTDVNAALSKASAQSPSAHQQQRQPERD